jgi:hypothetical protein
MSGTGDLRTWDAAGRLSLADALMPPALACIETGDDLSDEIESAASCLNPQGLLLSVTTTVVCRQNAARAFVAAIDRRIGLADEVHERIATAVHEATVNAAIHGGLEVGSELRDTIEGLALFSETIERRLSDPVYAKRRVRLRADWRSTRIVINIHDDGVKDRVEEIPQSIEADKAKSGRGLALLRILSNGVSLGRQLHVVNLFFDRQ